MKNKERLRLIRESEKRVEEIDKRAQEAIRKLDILLG